MTEHGAPPKVSNVYDAVVTRREVRIHTEPWPIGWRAGVRTYILPDLIHAALIDGKLETVSISGRKCTKDGRPLGSPGNRSNGYHVWLGSYETESARAPKWCIDMLREHGVDVHW